MAGEDSADAAEDSDWVRRPWARTFDLIAGEYGWTDDQILDLTLQRMRQVQDVIATRQEEKWRQDVRLEEVKLRYLVGAIHAAAGNKKAGKVADSVSLLPDEKPRHRKEPQVMAVRQAFGIDPAMPPISPDELAAEVERLKSDG